MCGICGKISPHGIDPAELKRMADVIAHRGPDDEGYYINPPVGLGHRRLSIIDLTKGKQPIFNEDNTIAIVFNGEIYNFKSLRSELLQQGHQFRTDTDTEVIVHLYEEIGERCVEKLGGMFAFAIWDEKEKKLFLARDRIGQKPLFFFQDGSDFVFGSEIKSVIEANNVPREINFEAIHHYLSLRFIPPPHTMMKNIHKLPAGHFLVFKDGKVHIERYWDLSFAQKLHLGEDDLIEGLDKQLFETIESHLVSDVPVGAFLSGGMDTSTVVAVMGNVLKSSFKTFSIGVEEQDFNELPYARMVAEMYHTEHIEEVVRADIIKLMPLMVWHLDEPSDPISACMFHAARLAARYVKVVLGGDGGDELFAGFDRYVGIKYIDYYNLIPQLIRTKLLRPFLNGMSDSFTYKSITQKLRWMDQLSQFSDGHRYAEATAFFRFNHEQKGLLFGPAVWGQLSKIISNQIIVDYYNRADSEDPLDKMLYADFMTRLAEHTLMLTDRMNMAHSLEARSPFLDHPLVEYMAKFPGDLKIKGRKLKYILRKVAAKYLPAEIIQREKQGFMFPVAYWFRNELYEFVKEFLLDSRFVREGVFRPEYITQLLEEHRDSKVDHHVRLWMLLNLEVWYRLYIEKQDKESIEQEILEKSSVHV